MFTLWSIDPQLRVVISTMGNIRQARNIGRKRGASKPLHKSGYLVLKALFKMLFLETSQIEKLCQMTRWTTNKFMRQLLDADLVSVWVRSLSESNIYSLKRAGVRALINRQDWDDSAIADFNQFAFRVPKGLDGNIDHLLAINDVRIAFALDLARLGGELARWRSDWELRSARRSLIPDSTFTILWDDRSEMEYSLELDNNTRSVTGFLKKLMRYQRQEMTTLRRSRTHRILVVGRDEQFTKRYGQAAGHIQIDLPVWFTTLRQVVDDAAGNIWVNRQTRQTYSLRQLSFLPYSKEPQLSQSVTNSNTSRSDVLSYIPDFERQEDQ